MPKYLASAPRDYDPWPVEVLVEIPDAPNCPTRSCACTHRSSLDRAKGRSWRELSGWGRGEGRPNRKAATS